MATTSPPTGASGIWAMRRRASTTIARFTPRCFGSVPVMAAFGTEDVRISLPAGGSLAAALARPRDVDAAAGSLPGMVVIHEIWGLNDDIRRIAARFADNGYVAAAPDLYSNGNKALCLSRTMLDMAGEGRGTMVTLE